MDVRDVQYYLKRKQGFPSITDQGALDILMGGEGLSFEIKLATALKSDQQNLFKVEKVKVNFSNLKLKIRRSRHKLLLALAKPILLKALRPAFEKAIEKNIKDNLENFDSFAYQVKLEAERAKQEVMIMTPIILRHANKHYRSSMILRMPPTLTADMLMPLGNKWLKANRNFRKLKLQQLTEK